MNPRNNPATVRAALVLFGILAPAASIFATVLTARKRIAQYKQRLDDLKAQHARV